jgi:hypothetical protein
VFITQAVRSVPLIIAGREAKARKNLPPLAGHSLFRRRRGGLSKPAALLRRAGRVGLLE